MAFSSNVGPAVESVNMWGNMPAIDLLNLLQKEGTLDDDMAIAFIASGDMRDVVRTVNELPLEYTGELTILINDRNHIVLSRNLALLLLLGTLEDKRRAADIAAHFWYSAFVPELYHTQLQLVMRKALEFIPHHTGDVTCTLTPTSRVEGCIGQVAASYLGLCSIISTAYDANDALNELSRARLVETSEDGLHRQYWPLESSHRLAYHEFRKYGLLLPFGAANAHFDHPNRLLFSLDGKWMQPDRVNPLNGWHIPSVIKTGKKHGALPMDIYGCLYFYVTDQLREFAERLTKLRITFKMFGMDASKLALELKSGRLETHGIPANFRFDRIDVSNLMDTHYLGVRPVIQSWGPLLKKTEHATLVGHFINWVLGHPKAVPGHHDIARIKKKCEEENLGPAVPPESSRNVHDAHLERSAIFFTSAYHVLYDSSGPFQEYLSNHNIHTALRKTGLKLKRHHDLVPHRLEGSFKVPSAVPSFRDARSWYQNVTTSDHTWSERYIELTWA
ncbi:uncharacterized protein FIBRA_00312 [Fibroporia radiculosa]|uniref:DUF4470 domain-containing protein n=1 Tax=Fibroporia radiculosa TaxID=599839 RepID=J7SCQ2_9APHY|nr:uncharacterized protein FIBRA_00312 [Fibroporia radiculosa]CCL98318.1 predicted protein [Fibroporia radiculosa]